MLSISRSQQLQFFFFMAKVKCEKKQCYTEVLWCCRDVLAYKSCSPDVRKCLSLEQIRVKLYR